jgi:hypothetical protein
MVTLNPDIDKLIQICGYMLRKYDFRLNYTKLIKILYLADKESLKETALTITSDSYINMQNGPVLSSLYDLIRGTYADSAGQILWNCRFTTDGYDLLAVVDRFPEGKLSLFEKDVLNRIDEQFHDKNFSEMIAYVHRKDVCPEWKNPKHSTNAHAAVPIAFEDILKSIDYSDDEIAWILEEKRAFEAEDNLFRTMAEA